MLFGVFPKLCEKSFLSQIKRKRTFKNRKNISDSFDSQYCSTRVQFVLTRRVTFYVFYTGTWNESTPLSSVANSSLNQLRARRTRLLFSSSKRRFPDHQLVVPIDDCESIRKRKRFVSKSNSEKQRTKKRFSDVSGEMRRF